MLKRETLQQPYEPQPRLQNCVFFEAITTIKKLNVHNIFLSYAHVFLMISFVEGIFISFYIVTPFSIDFNEN